ncbi:MAG: corrinoid protein [Abditibacteriota bacterium]|nr:corrinoid protein [Abditibacteriota bacterium]
MADFNTLSEAIIAGDQAGAKTAADELIADGASDGDDLEPGLVAGMNVVGAKFKANEFYIPEVLLAARAMKGAMEVLRPLLAETGVKPVAKIAVGTVKGDQHDIGKNIVAMMMEGAGFEVTDLGINVGPDKFVEQAKEGARILLMSALLTTTMPAMKANIEALKAAGLRDKVLVMVGGAPVTQAFADEIGADGYSDDAASAVEKARELLGL